jgi:hypothetical protein
MKLNPFDDIKPAYIAVNGNGFNVAEKTYSELKCFIKDIIPVRKLFRGRKMECYSNNAKKGKNGEYCALCKKRTQCRQRIRLMLLLHDEDEETPAILEINTNSHDNLRKSLEHINDDELSIQLIVLNIEKKDKYIQIQFNPIF